MIYRYIYIYIYIYIYTHTSHPYNICQHIQLASIGNGQGLHSPSPIFAQLSSAGLDKSIYFLSWGGIRSPRPPQKVGLRPPKSRPPASLKGCPYASICKHMGNLLGRPEADLLEAGGRLFGGVWGGGCPPRIKNIYFFLG